MHFRRTNSGKFGGSVAASVLCFLAAGAAHAFSYKSDDMIAVFVNAGTELIADLGNPTTLTNGQTFTLSTSGTLGPTAGVGGIFTALAVGGTLGSGTSNRTIFYTTDSSLTPLPPTYDNPPNTKTITDYVRKINAAQFGLDDGNGNGWMNGLNLLPAADGSTILINQAALLAIISSAGSSYTTNIGKGTNEIGGQLPFSTANLGNPPSLGASSVFPLWEATQTALNTSHTVQIGSLDVLANPNGDGSAVKIEFQAVPEPGTLLLVSLGLTALLTRGAAPQRRGVPEQS